jgi:hypothetical protein
MLLFLSDGPGAKGNGGSCSGPLGKLEWPPPDPRPQPGPDPGLPPPPNPQPPSPPMGGHGPPDVLVLWRALNVENG